MTLGLSNEQILRLNSIQHTIETTIAIRPMNDLDDEDLRRGFWCHDGSCMGSCAMECPGSCTGTCVGTAY